MVYTLDPAGVPRWLFVFATDAWSVLSVEIRPPLEWSLHNLPMTDAQIFWEVVGKPRTLLAHALTVRIPVGTWTKAFMTMVLRDYYIPEVPGNRQNMMEVLVKTAFPLLSGSEVEAFVQDYLAQPTLEEDEESVCDEVTREVLASLDPLDARDHEDLQNAVKRKDIKAKHGIKRKRELCHEQVERHSHLKSSEAWLHALMPAVDGTLVDRIMLHRIERKACYTARYELNSSFEVPASLPKAYVQKTKTKHFAAHVSEMKALRYVTTWLWAKHFRLFGVAMPDNVKCWLLSKEEIKFCDFVPNPAPVVASVPAVVPANVADSSASSSSSSSSSSNSDTSGSD